MLPKSNSYIQFFKYAFLKQISVLLFCLSANISSYAKTYYFSGSTGNDSYSSTQAQSQSTPWKTISKLNAVMSTLVSGDQVLFKSGDIFYGTISPTVSGVTFSSYGTGAKPIITGLTTVSAWTSVGTNLWEAPIPNGLSTLNTVVINGVLTPMGRYPNTNATNGGYLTYESFVTNVSLTDNQLSASPNWTGGEVVVRRVDYTTDRAKITNHSGNTITFSTYAGVAMHAGYGYFIQNHTATLDQKSEWFYNPSTKKIRIYYTGTPPAIQVSTLASLVSMVYPSNAQKSNITFRGISFKGSEGIMMNIVYASNITVDNCDLAFAGVNAIEYRYVSYLKVLNSSISDVNMIGIQDYPGNFNNNITIQNNTIRRIGINAGMISNAYGESVSSTGINAQSSNLLIQQNTIDSVGYIAIALRTNKNNQVVRKNVISNFCSVKNDGGAIYNAGLRGSAPVTTTVIDSNIISKAIGAIAGTLSTYDKHTRAIYLDATSTNVNVLHNTIFDAWDAIYMSQAQNIVIKGNTVYNTGNYKPAPLNYYSAALVINDAFDGYQHVRNNVVTNNIFFSKYPDQLAYYQTDRYNGISQIGVLDSNYYANPGADVPIFLTNTTLATVYSLAQWKAAYSNYDRHSKGSPRKIPQFIVNSTAGANKLTNELFSSNVSGTSISSAAKVATLSWDNTSKINGSGSAKLTSSVVSTNFTSLYQMAGPVTKGKKYLLRFKTRATKPGMFKASIHQYSGCYCLNSPVQTGSVDTAIKQNELLFSWDTTSQATAAIYIDFSQDNSTIYVDDMQFYEATATPTNVDDYHRFDYNPTSSPVTVPLAFNYIGVDGTVYNTGSITLAPYSSKILLKDTGTVKTNPVVTAGKLTAAAVAGPVNCSGTSYPVTVSATGGTAPYTGTGVFNTNAGKGSLKISFPASIATSSTVIYASVGAITAGKNYVLRFSTLGTTANGKLNVLIRKTAAPSTILTDIQTTTFGASRIDHQFNFVPTLSDADGSINIEIAQNSGTTFFDNIAFFEVNSTGNFISVNLFRNGQFETDITGINIWSSNNNQAAVWDSYYRMSNINYYTVTDAAGSKSTVGILIKQPAAILNAAASAGIIPRAGGTTTVSVTASGGIAPYSGTGTFTVSAGTYSYTVKDANGCSTTTRITIGQPSSRVANSKSVGTDLSKINLNDITALKINSFPNPTSAAFNLSVEGGSEEKINIIAMGTDGRIIYQTTGASNQVYKFGSNFAAGIYIIKVMQGNTMQTIKVIKTQ